MSLFLRWFARASGVLFVTLLGVMVTPRTYATFRVTEIQPSFIYCTHGSFLGTLADVKCYNEQQQRAPTISIKIQSDQEELLKDTTYLLRLSRDGDDQGSTFGVARQKPNPNNPREIIFNWDLRGWDKNGWGPVAQPGEWTVRMFVDGGSDWGGRPQQGEDMRPFEPSSFIIYESLGRNPTFRAKASRYQINTDVVFEILNAAPNTAYTVWWDGERNFKTYLGKIKVAIVHSNADGSLKTPPTLPGSDSPRRKACMAIGDGDPAGFTCNNYYTWVEFTATKIFDPGPASRPDGKLNANPSTGEPYRSGSATRQIVDPRPYDIVQFCQDAEGKDAIQTGLGCIPTTPSGLTTFLLRFAIGIGGGAALLIMAFGSIQMMTAQGDPEKLNEGKEKFVGALAGLLFIIFSIFLLNVIGVQIFAIPGFPR